jgi:mRNA interferase MazF
MGLNYHPAEGEVLKCDFSGFTAPEMIKVRWVVVISPKHINRGPLTTIVPLSTTPPNPIERYHVKLESTLPHNEGSNVEVWAKCDMLFSASFTRLNAWWLDKSTVGRRVYIPIAVSKEDVVRIKAGVLHSLGLSGLTRHLF